MLADALSNALFPTRPMTWTEAFVLSSGAVVMSLPVLAGMYLVKSAAGINLMNGPSPLHDLLFWIVV